MSRPIRWFLPLVLIATSGVSIAGATPTADAPRFGAWMTESDRRDAWFGWAVGVAGDVNGDGHSDVLVGAYRWTEGEATRQGRTWAYHGSATGPSSTPDWIVDGHGTWEYFGHSVSTAGDVNGDGYDDVIVGAPHFDHGETDEGSAWVFLGSPAGLAATPAWSAESDQAGSLFGRWVGSAGDVNGDAFDDVIVGAHFYDGDQQDEGRVFAYHGSVDGLSSTPNWTADGNQAMGWFGRAVSRAGDVNGDGFDDVIVGAPKFDNDQVNEGRAFAFYGTADGLNPDPDWIAEADQAEAWFGRRLSWAGDVNADAYDDVIVAAPNYDTGRPNGGKVFVHLGSPAGLGQAPGWTAQLDQANAWFGRSVSSAGDVNADGLDDVIIGAPLYDDGQKDEGAAWVFAGPLAGQRERSP